MEDIQQPEPANQQIEMDNQPRQDNPPDQPNNPQQPQAADQRQQQPPIDAPQANEQPENNQPPPQRNAPPLAADNNPPQQEQQPQEPAPNPDVPPPQPQAQAPPEEEEQFLLDYIPEDIEPLLPPQDPHRFQPWQPYGGMGLNPLLDGLNLNRDPLDVAARRPRQVRFAEEHQLPDRRPHPPQFPRFQYPYNRPIQPPGLRHGIRRLQQQDRPPVGARQRRPIADIPPPQADLPPPQADLPPNDQHQLPIQQQLPGDNVPNPAQPAPNLLGNQDDQPPVPAQPLIPPLIAQPPPIQPPNANQPPRQPQPIGNNRPPINPQGQDILRGIREMTREMTVAQQRALNTLGQQFHTDRSGSSMNSLAAKTI